MKTNKNYYPQINVIKAIASFSVTAVHFRNRVETTIPEAIVNNKIKMFFSINYSLFIFAVPLFLLTTGFLSVHKKHNKQNMINTLKIYLLYLFMSFISFGLMVLTDNKEFYGWKDMISRALSFDLISGWYIEMFIGLALIIPFLNITINNISKKEFQSLIIILITVISIPSLINRNPDLTGLYLPNYWQASYPIVYYFIGAYIRIYMNDLDIGNKTLFSFYILSVTFIIQLLYRHADPYTWTAEGYYSSIVNVVLASSFFILILKNVNKSHFILDLVSKYTLSTYIMAYPIDKISQVLNLV